MITNFVTGLYIYYAIIILECTPTYKEKFVMKQCAYYNGSSLVYPMFTTSLDCFKRQGQ